MKTYDLQSPAINQKPSEVWDEFVNYLESIYFEGAAELLDTKLIAFEYNDYKRNFSD